MRQRTAFTLVETLMTMSIGSAIMVLSIQLVHQSLVMSSTGDSRIDHLRSLDRLARDFRRDAHLARTIAMESDNPNVVEMSGTVNVTYELESNRVRRIETLPNGDRRRESYALLSGSIVSFQEQDNPRRLILVVERAANLNTGHTPLDRRVEAVVGRRLMLQEGEVSQ